MAALEGLESSLSAAEPALDEHPEVFLEAKVEPVHHLPDDVEATVALGRSVAEVAVGQAFAVLHNGPRERCPLV